MKTMKKFASLLLALAMIFALATTVAAQTISITPPTGIDSEATNTYKIYKVFNATVNNDGKIAYTLADNKTTVPDGFTLTNGYITYSGSGTDALTPDDIVAIGQYVTEDDLVDTVYSTGTDVATSNNLDAGYYYITTSTGSVVTIDSTTETTVTVQDKNTIPVVDKKITGASSVDADGKKALAQIGTDVTYTATITVGKGAKNYVFHDIMGSGLTFKGNDSVTVTGADGKYTIKDTPDAGDTLTISFTDGIPEGTTITISYVATINKSALTADPEKNTAYVSYGDSYETTHTETAVYNAKFTVTKEDGDAEPLAGAGFVIMKDSKYYKFTVGTDDTPAKVEWVDDIANATEYTSDENGDVTPFIGLANGNYTLVEKTVPAGYNKANDISFEIKAGDYTAKNLQQSATVTNNAGAELPSTGGMGTTLFYVVGGILVAAAAVLLVTKKRMAN